MIYSNSENTELGLDASVLSVKADFERKISIVQERYTDIYNAIISEYNSLVEFLAEFRRMTGVIVDECNRLQGLTDEELTNIKKKIEELKNILDSIDIPDLPSIKPPEEIIVPDFGGGDEEDDTACHIGFGATVTGLPPGLGGGGRGGGIEDGSSGSRFYCGEYDALAGGVGYCQSDYITWDPDGVGTCVHDYSGDGGVPVSPSGSYGCISDYTDGAISCPVNYQSSSSSDSCYSGYKDETIDLQCDNLFVHEPEGIDTCDGYSMSGTLCDEGYSYDLTNGDITCAGYSETGLLGTTNCPGGFSDGSVKMCNVGFTADGVSCVSGYLSSTAGADCTSGQNITSCPGGYTNGNVSCPSNWSESENNGNRGCQRDFSDGTVTCHNYYLTDGTFAGCGSGDNICSPCIGTYCPSYSPSCTGCDNPRCYGCDDPNCYSNDGCGEGETPVVPPCGEGCGNCEAMCQGVGDAPSCGNYDEANCGSTAKGAWDGCTEGQPICAGIWCGMSQS